MDILGGIASAVQLASLCYQISEHFARRSEDKALLTSLETQIIRLQVEMNARLSELNPTSRQAAQDFSNRLGEILDKIVSFRTKKRFLLLKSLGLFRASGIWKEFMIALQIFQVKVTTLEGDAVNQILERADRAGSKREMTGILDPIIEQLKKLEALPIWVEKINSNYIKVHAKLESLVVNQHEIRLAQGNSGEELRVIRRTMENSISNESILQELAAIKALIQMQSVKMNVVSSSSLGSTQLNRSGLCFDLDLGSLHDVSRLYRACFKLHGKVVLMIKVSQARNGSRTLRFNRAYCVTNIYRTLQRSYVCHQ